MRLLNKKEAIALFLRKGYEAMFMLQCQDLEYDTIGPIENCIGTVCQLCQDKSQSSAFKLVIEANGQHGEHLIVEFSGLCLDAGLVQLQYMVLRSKDGGKESFFDLAHADLPRYRELPKCMPGKRSWLHRLFRSAAIMVLILACYSAKAQISFLPSDLLKQNKKNLQYMAQQVAELQVYISALKKGYKIVHSGLETIRKVRNGEFDLHNLFYTGLWKVNPAILKVPALAQTYFQIQSSYSTVKRVRHQLRSDTILRNRDRALMLEVCDNLVADIDGNLSDLTNIITPGRLQMDDQERIRRIYLCQQRSVDHRFVAQGIADQSAWVSWVRTKELVEIQTIDNLFK